jgi:putative FmdB family regulatory protein
MPVYEYECNNCGQRIEVEATVKEKEKGLKVKCPKCGSEDVFQVFSCFVMGSDSGNDSTPGCGCGGGSCGF